MAPEEFLETVRDSLDEAYVVQDYDRIQELEGMYHGAMTMYEIFKS